MTVCVVYVGIYAQLPTLSRMCSNSDVYILDVAFESLKKSSISAYVIFDKRYPEFPRCY